MTCNLRAAKATSARLLAPATLGISQDSLQDSRPLASKCLLGTHTGFCPCLRQGGKLGSDGRKAFVRSGTNAGYVTYAAYHWLKLKANMNFSRVSSSIATVVNTLCLMFGQQVCQYLVWLAAVILTTSCWGIRICIN